MPRLSVIIVTFNSAADIDACLASVGRQIASIDHEILVVDNHSTDGTVAGIRDRWPDVQLIIAPGNVGFAAANNLGIARAHGDLLLLLNPDTVVRAGAIDMLVRALDAHSDVAIVGPRLVDRHGRAELSFGAMITPFTELRQKLLVKGHEARWPFVTGFVERMTRRAGFVDWVSGACLLVRRPDAIAAGLFDERYFMYGEDVDFCAAVRRKGRRVLFVADAEVQHLRGQSHGSASARVEAAYRRSQIAFYQKHHPRWAPWLRAYLRLRGTLPDTR